MKNECDDKWDQHTWQAINIMQKPQLSYNGVNKGLSFGFHGGEEAMQSIVSMKGFIIAAFQSYNAFLFKCT